MLPDWSQWTNDPETWKELGLDSAGCFLWRLDIRAPEDYYHGWFDAQYRDITSRLGWAQARMIFIIDREGWATDFFFDDPRVHVWDSTVLNDDHPAHDRFHPNFFWFDWTREIESYQNSKSKMRDPLDGDWTFECMLGRRKPWRDFIYETIINDPELSAEVLLSYPGRTGHWQAGFDHDIQSVESTDRIGYHDLMTGNRSCFLPWRIYNRSFYSLVAETTHDRLFFTEKTAKPLLAGRLFLLFAAPGSLKALKKLGFQTFSELIDESYDDIVDHDRRWKSVLDQAKELSKYDRRKVQEKIQPILEHNYQQFMSMDGRASLRREIEELL